MKKENIKDAKHIQERIDFTTKIPLAKIDWIKDKKLDVPYGKQTLQTFDLYYPNDDKNRPYPTIILVHGGGFMVGDKRDWHAYPGFFALDEGFALVSANYRLSPPAKFPEPIDDITDLILYLRKNAETLGIDPDNLFLYGTSSGGNIVTRAGIDGEATRGTKKDSHVNGVAALCPLINFETHISQSSLKTRLTQLLIIIVYKFNYLGKRPFRDKTVMRSAAADIHISKAKSLPPFYIQHGDMDTFIPTQQSIDLYEKLQTTGLLDENSLTLDILKGAYHAGAGPHYIEPQNVMPILAFFKRHLL